jgi:hypothetical protein
MRFATRNEIEYLNAIDGESVADAHTIDEMTRWLDALRRFDQNFCQADWRPEHNRRVRLPNTNRAGG